MISKRRVLSLLALAASACGADGPTGSTDGGGLTVDAAPVDGGTDAPIVAYLSGIYFVPERTEESTYPVAEVTWATQRGRATLAYNLPRMLVGQSERVALSGPLSADGMEAVLEGPIGTATCTLGSTGVLLHCVEHFVDLSVDLDRVREEAMDDDPTRVDARVAVAERFSNDPIGVLEATEYVRAPAPAVPCTGDAECGASGRCDIEAPPEVGFCEVHGPVPLGGACETQLDCAADLECEFEWSGVGTCAPHGGD